MYKLTYLATIFLLLPSCQTKQHLISVDTDYIRLSENLQTDTILDNLIEPYRTTLSAQMEVEVGMLEEELIKAKPTSNLGNWFTDIMYDESDKMFFEPVDFAIQNYGGLRIQSLSKGPLTIGKIYELMPFDNMLVVLNLPASTVQKLFDGLAQSGGWPISRTVTFTISKNGTAEKILIKGKPLEEGRTYRVALPDYVANGGDQAEILRSFEQENSGVFIRDIVIEHLKDRQKAGLPIIVDDSQRITNSK